MDIHTRDKIIYNIMLLLSGVSSELPPENIKDARELLEHDEWGEAFDLICTQLYEYEVAITKDLYTTIEQTGVMMGMEPGGWAYLKELVS